MIENQGSIGMDGDQGKRELARLALLEAVGGPRQGVPDLCVSLDLDPADFAKYWDGHSEVPDAVARRLVDHLERRIESMQSLVSALRFCLDDRQEAS